MSPHLPHILFPTLHRPSLYLSETDAQGTELLPVTSSGDKSKVASASASAAAAAAAKVWHTKTAAECLAELETCATGLTTARVAEVYARVGPNALAEKPKPTFFERLWDQVRASPPFSQYQSVTRGTKPFDKFHFFLRKNAMANSWARISALLFRSS